MALKYGWKCLNSISDAENTYQKISNFRDALFNDSIYQSKAIICSAFRIMELKARITSHVTKKNPTCHIHFSQEFNERLKKIFNDQKLIEITYNNRDKFRPESTAVIEQSKQYTNSLLSFVISIDKKKKIDSSYFISGIIRVTGLIMIIYIMEIIVFARTII